MDQRLIGAAAALISAASWALGSILFKKLGDQLPPAALTLAKGAVGTVILGLSVLYLQSAPVDVSSLSMLILSGVLGIAVGDTLFFKALDNLGAHAVVVLLTLGQVVTLMLAVVWLHEMPSSLDWVGIAAIVAGVALVLCAQISEGSNSRMIGIACGVGAVICMSLATIIAKEALSTMESVQAAFVRMFAGTVGILFFVLAQKGAFLSLKPLCHPRFAAFFLLSVMVITFGGFWLSLFAMKTLDVTIANTLGSTEPLFVIPLAAIFLRETIKPIAVAGSCLAVSGIVIMLRPWAG
ncbi:DMT family transporter [Bradyrhizobium sp. ORS 111]|uniref:DMT family transporter n=1 Tax=Bradyrhizobium sp. ORS 111 TaxID=1685958 RepID=UPI00388ED8FB